MSSFDSFIRELTSIFLSVNVQTYSPESNYGFALRPTQVVWGRTGNDFLTGYNPNLNKVGDFQIDIFIGDQELSTLPDPKPRKWSDTFILGDWRQAYYTKGNALLLGLNDLAFIVDFEPNLDKIQLKGSSADYELIPIDNLTAIVSVKNNSFDVVGVLPVKGLTKQGNYFQYMGDKRPTLSPIHASVQQFGSVGIDLGISSVTDKLGNIYTVGSSNGSLTNSKSISSFNSWITKHDSNGKKLWTRQFNKPDANFAFDIAIDQQNNLYVSGYTYGNLVQPRQGAVSDAWLGKFNSNGTQLWLKQFGTDVINSSFSVDVTNQGNVVISGYTVKPSKDGAAFLSTDDTWVAQYDSNGKRLWFSEFGTPASLTNLDFDESYSVTASPDGSVYSSGWTLGNLGGKNAGLYDVWVAKHNSVGKLEWIKQLGSKDHEWAWDMDTDSQGNVYVTGWTLGNLGGANKGSYDAFVAKYNPQGAKIWVKQFGSAGDDNALGINIKNDSIFLTGMTNGNLAGANKGSYDGWVANYDLNGTQKWIKQFGSANYDYINDVTVDNNNRLYVTGFTQGSLGNFNSGATDAWLLKANARSGQLLSFPGTKEPIKNSLLNNHGIKPITNTPSTNQNLLRFNQSKNELISLLSTKTGSISPPNPLSQLNSNSLGGLTQHLINPIAEAVNPYTL